MICCNKSAKLNFFCRIKLISTKKMNDMNEIYHDVVNNTGNITTIEGLVGAFDKTKLYKGISFEKNNIINQFKNIDKKHRTRLRLQKKLDAKNPQN